LSTLSPVHTDNGEYHQ